MSTENDTFHSQLHLLDSRVQNASVIPGILTVSRRFTFVVNIDVRNQRYGIAIGQSRVDRSLSSKRLEDEDQSEADENDNTYLRGKIPMSGKNHEERGKLFHYEGLDDYKTDHALFSLKGC